MLFPSSFFDLSMIAEFHTSRLQGKSKEGRGVDPA